MAHEYHLPSKYDVPDMGCPLESALIGELVGVRGSHRSFDSLWFGHNYLEVTRIHRAVRFDGEANRFYSKPEDRMHAFVCMVPVNEAPRLHAFVFVRFLLGRVLLFFLVLTDTYIQL